MRPIAFSDTIIAQCRRAPAVGDGVSASRMARGVEERRLSHSADAHRIQMDGLAEVYFWPADDYRL